MVIMILFPRAYLIFNKPLLMDFYTSWILMPKRGTGAAS